eukprot:CAMPEP_0196582132 /NCGR_PEP_ID=MMETSP1081-20130531/37607_1 /TAXON_ID=36882 /ORGANISM="Pyramimonas amylifera, Strain CCMP720" /LENGTH=231 /DNA_ID=CAMNT_0041902615 /DNA_START=150 /DNA_END=845 /DNA_ORIENTATION=-
MVMRNQISPFSCKKSVLPLPALKQISSSICGASLRSFSSNKTKRSSVISVTRKGLKVSMSDEQSGECTSDDYLVLGVAKCFEKVDNKLEERLIVEPVTAGTIESMAAGAVTSYLACTSIKYGDAIQMDLSALPEDFQGLNYGDDFVFRCGCAARTWARPHAVEMLQEIVPWPPEVRSDWNFLIESKRILNFVNEVNDSDNIKQDISIDVYGRSEEDTKNDTDKAIEDSYNA